MCFKEIWKKLKLCRTRWVECHKALRSFLICSCCLEAIVYCTPSDWNRETHSDAQSLLLSMSQFSFMVALVLSQKSLLTQKGSVWSCKGDGQYVDVVWAHKDIESVKAVISGVRSRVDDFHLQVSQEVLTLSQSVDVAESAPNKLLHSSIDRMPHQTVYLWLLQV